MIRAVKAEDVLPDREEEQRQDKKRRDTKRYIALGILGVVGLVVWYGFQPIKGPIQVGICRTFAELNLTYPETFRLYGTEQFERSWRLYYTYIGPFGENSANMIECRFANDPRRGLVLDHVLLNRVEMDAQTIEAFNKTIPIVLAYKPNQIIPGAAGDSLVGLKKN